MTGKKPKLTVAEARMFCEVDEHIRRYGTHHSHLEQSFSDVHDSNLYAREVAPLIRKRLLRRLPLSEGERYGDCCLMGHTWTVDMTDRAMQTFWPALYAQRLKRK